jgi:hypothetical protein
MASTPQETRSVKSARRFIYLAGAGVVPRSGSKNRKPILFPGKFLIAEHDNPSFAVNQLGFDA